MKIHPKFLFIVVTIVTVFITLMITDSNSKATMLVPDKWSGVTYRLDFTEIYPNIAVYAKNLDTGFNWSTTSNEIGVYGLPVAAGDGANFYLKAWKASDHSQRDEDYVWHEGNNSEQFHDFSLSPPA